VGVFLVTLFAFYVVAKLVYGFSKAFRQKQLQSVADDVVGRIIAMLVAGRRLDDSQVDAFFKNLGGGYSDAAAGASVPRRVAREWLEMQRWWLSRKIAETSLAHLRFDLYESARAFAEKSADAQDADILQTQQQIAIFEKSESK